MMGDCEWVNGEFGRGKEKGKRGKEGGRSVNHGLQIRAIGLRIAIPRYREKVKEPSKK